jgi:hypothetical protein
MNHIREDTFVECHYLRAQQAKTLSYNSDETTDAEGNCIRTLLFQAIRSPMKQWKAERSLSTCIDYNKFITNRWERKTDTQRGVLSGLSRKRHLRSKIWWFTEFCNSHYISHFAAFFIVTRTEISAVKSCVLVVIEETSNGLSTAIEKGRYSSQIHSPNQYKYQKG